MHKSQSTPNFVVEHGILSFPQLFKAEQINGQGDPKFTASILLPEEQAKQVMATAQKLAAEAFKNGEPQLPNFHWPIMPAQQKKAYQDDPRFAGMYVMNTSARAEYPPQVVDQNRQPVLDYTTIYAGCHVAVSIRLYSWTHKMGTLGISAGLLAVMKTGDGEPLGGGGVDVNAAFANVQTEVPAAPVAGGNGAAPAGMRMPWE